ncbi:hypothetical protein MGLY_35600 (plasmid) [Neomoorella glycerini]|uniref:Uncharacterized protein n=1 Tax=Neomoorella glycerini TaxID=55779 RepID=A0A6I5ZWX7_9FIRM|nr:hypothetical protein [Moorella glycerini]QGP94135.1 hypothetical protein MGLY_35600 [Moorella glycerini]
MGAKLRRFCYWAGAKVAVLKSRDGISTLELLIILGLATIILGATYFTASSFITPWWNNKIKPQFPQ